MLARTRVRSLQPVRGLLAEMWPGVLVTAALAWAIVGFVSQ